MAFQGPRDKGHAARSPSRRVRGPGLVATLVALVTLLPFAGALAGLPLDAPSLAPPTPSRHAEGSSAEGYAVTFRCAGESSTTATVTCPAYVLDREDVMGQPVLLVDPNVPDLVAFSALHGGRGLHAAPGDEPPTERSRSNVVHQPHTTFLSRDGGDTWLDRPYRAPDAMAKTGREVYGEDNAAALDADGRIYLASLYSYVDGAAFTAPSPARFAVGVWKARGIDKDIDYHVNSKVLYPKDESATLDSVHLVSVPDADAVVLLWREGNATVAHWTRPGDGALWTRIEKPVAEGCDAVSNPIAVAREVFVACRGADRVWRVHALDASTWASRLVDETPLDEPHALLVPRGPWGLMVLIGSGLSADNATPSVRIAYGELGARWSSPDDVGAKLTRATVAAPLADARVTAAAYAPESGNLHLVYAERTDAARTANVDADRPEFTKVLASVQAEGAFQGLVDLQVGRLSRVDFSPTLTGVGSGAFSDLHDGIVVVDTPDGPREFLAYGDYGFVRYAEVVEENYLPPVAPVNAPIPAIPAASGGLAPVLVGVPAGLLSGAMVARTLMARRKHAVEAPTE